MSELQQNPGPGARVTAHAGDVLELTLTLPSARTGTAWVRTNVGRVASRRKEIIGHTEEQQALLSRDWHDIVMQKVDDLTFSVHLPLAEVGRFELKAFFLPEEDPEPVWPQGENVVLKVEPAAYCCGNMMYTAFVRQFGPHKGTEAPPKERHPQVEKLQEHGFAVIPPSGTFRDVIKELDFIIGKMGFRILQLLPIHPTPTTYARMGKYGSPFAALDFMDVDPALAEFDRRTTPMDQFIEFVDAVHARGAKVFIDIPVNHTGWGSRLQIEHPEWFARNDHREFQSPGAWGVTWADLAELDYSHRGLWEYMAGVYLFWCRHGVDGFRCDAGYMIPFAAWEYIVAKVREQYPNTVFFLEGLGGKIEVMERLLGEANLDWAYSELFQNYDRRQIEQYVPGAIRISREEGLLVHFAETHDNPRLASRSHAYSKMRCALTSLLSLEGAFGITNGVEWFCDRKLDVHDAPSLDWGRGENQVDDLIRINTILRTHSCFHPGAELRLVHSGGTNAIAVLRKGADGMSLMILVNLSDTDSGEIVWPAAEFPFESDSAQDLLTGRAVSLQRAGEEIRCSLEAGEVLCLSGHASDVKQIESACGSFGCEPDRVRRQRLRAKVLEVQSAFHGTGDVIDVDIDDLADHLARNPSECCSRIARREDEADAPPVVTRWNWPRDVRRLVMVPNGHLLLMESEYPFRAALCRDHTVLRREESLPLDTGGHFAVLSIPENGTGGRMRLESAVYEPDACRHAEADLLYLSGPEMPPARMSFSARETDENGCYALCVNGRGAMAQVRGAWGEIRSQYDAMLAGNLHPDYPVDRHVMFTRCRAWLVYQGYYQDIGRDCLEHFEKGPDGSVTWSFLVPSGRGMSVSLSARLTMAPDHNAVRLVFRRPRREADDETMDDEKAVRLIVRPDIEDRSCHEKTKAYKGPETEWPRAVVYGEKDFTFRPSGDRRLRVTATAGGFTWEPEWTYMVPHPLDGERGLDDASDLFSPGYFSFLLKGGDSIDLRAHIITGKDEEAFPEIPEQKETGSVEIGLAEAALRATGDFVVKRGALKTVVAGYPWFLDWGRDVLICLRGMIAAGMLQEASDILAEFGRFERGGTLPNMIRGGDDSNRDTSDAPLWFFVACSDFVGKAGARDLLERSTDGRTIRDILLSIAKNYISGTEHGVRMDEKSGLVYSPAHFTWMDTNYPAGTPRQGYPVEIQALWYAAVHLLDDLEEGGEWGDLADKVRRSIQAYYLPSSAEDGNGRYLADCLHCEHGVAAEDAEADDALRPNQLLAVTLGAVTEASICRSIVSTCEQLLVPGAVRSLADAPVRYPLPIRREGALLNDPRNPYWGRYRGDEDTRRKPAYHNGTAWTWLFPSYAEALLLVYGSRLRHMARTLLGSSAEIVNSGCIGHFPEILDGDAPHAQRGCGAQAWGATEWLRVWKLLEES